MPVFYERVKLPTRERVSPAPVPNAPARHEWDDVHKMPVMGINAREAANRTEKSEKERTSEAVRVSGSRNREKDNAENAWESLFYPHN